MTFRNSTIREDRFHRETNLYRWRACSITVELAQLGLCETEVLSIWWFHFLCWKGKLVIREICAKQYNGSPIVKLVQYPATVTLNAILPPNWTLGDHSCFKMALTKWRVYNANTYRSATWIFKIAMWFLIARIQRVSIFIIWYMKHLINLKYFF